MSQGAPMESSLEENAQETSSTNEREMTRTVPKTDQQEQKLGHYTSKEGNLSMLKSNTSDGNKVRSIRSPAPSQQQASINSSKASTDEEKPAPGSAEWHRIRRENHKKVERRRREAINEGINDLARLVPNCEKNKGQILRRAAEYIEHLKRLDAANAEKWTLEKLLMDQALNEMNSQVQDLKSQVEQLRQENDMLKKQLHQNPKKRNFEERNDQESRKEQKTQ